MRRIASIFVILATLLALLILMASGIILTREDDVIIGWVVKNIEKETGMSLRYGDDSTISRSLHPVLRIPELEVAGADDRFAISTELAELKVGLPALLLGRLALTAVRLDDIRVELPQGGELAAGQIAADTRVSLSGEIPVVSGALVLRDLALPSFDGTADEKDPAGDSESALAVFSRDPLDFDWLRTVALDLEVDIESFATNGIQAKSAQLGLRMDEDLLSIKPARLVYAKGQVDLELEIRTGPVPRVRLSATGENVDPWGALGIQEGESSLPTDVDLDISLTAAGNSAHALAASANGHAEVIMRNGRLRRTLTHLLFVDVVGWTISRTTQDSYVPVDCGLLDFTMVDGVVKTNAAYIEGENIAVTGDGTIDLGREEIDLVLLPKRKTSVIGKADPVRLHGPLRKPDVKVLPWKAAAKTYGGLVFAPHIFLSIKAVEGLLDTLRKEDEASPCLDYKPARK